MGSSTGPQVEASDMDLGSEVFPGGVCAEGSGSLGEPHLTVLGRDEDLVRQGSFRPDAMETIADDVDSFFDDFLYLASASGENGSAVIGADCDIEVTDSDLAWLQDPDVFMPTPAHVETSPSTGDESSENTFGPLEERSDRVEKKLREQLGESEPTSSDGSSASSQQPLLPSPLLVDCRTTEMSTESSEDSDVSPTFQARETSLTRDAVRREKVRRYLEKKKRRKWLRAASYKSRQRVANERPRHKGRFLPLESEFIPIAELQRRQRALVKQYQLQQPPQAV